jgi:transposase
MKILALDLGKDKSVGCEFTSETGEHTFVTIRTCPSEVAQLFEQIRPDRVVIEIGPLAGWVADIVRSMSIELQVANPNHEAWRWRKVKAKTDRLDAHKLARLSAMNQLPLVHVPPIGERQWRSMIAYRQALVRPVAGRSEAGGAAADPGGAAGCVERHLVDGVAGAGGGRPAHHGGRGQA